MTKDQEKKVIQLLPDIVRSESMDDARNEFAKFLDSDQVDYVIEILQVAMGRAALHSLGLSPAQFNGDYEANAIFKESVKIASQIQGQSKKLDTATLIAQFNDLERKDRHHTLNSLLKHEFSGDKEVLENSLLDNDKLVQITAVQNLSKRRISSKLKKALLELLTTSNDDTVVINIFRKIQELELKQTSNHVINKLETDNLAILYSGIQCLGEIGKKSVITNLEKFKAIDEVANSFDENGSLIGSTSFTISEVTEQAIKRIKKRNHWLKQLIK